MRRREGQEGAKFCTFDRFLEKPRVPSKKLHLLEDCAHAGKGSCPLGAEGGDFAPKGRGAPKLEAHQAHEESDAGSRAVDEAPSPCEPPASPGQRVLRAPRGLLGARTASRSQLRVVPTRGDAARECSIRGSMTPSPAAAPGGHTDPWQPLLLTSIEDIALREETSFLGPRSKHGTSPLPEGSEPRCHTEVASVSNATQRCSDGAFGHVVPVRLASENPSQAQR